MKRARKTVKQAFLALQERLADAEDLLELREAKRAVPPAEAKRRLGLA